MTDYDKEVLRHVFTECVGGTVSVKDVSERLGVSSVSLTFNLQRLHESGLIWMDSPGTMTTDGVMIKITEEGGRMAYAYMDEQLKKRDDKIRHFQTVQIALLSVLSGSVLAIAGLLVALFK